MGGTKVASGKWGGGGFCCGQEVMIVIISMEVIISMGSDNLWKIE